VKMKGLPLLKKQVLILLVFSIAVAVAAIIHGIFFDLDFSQIKRLTMEGFLLTLFVVFPTILFLEWVFDLNNKKKFEELEREIGELKK
jgi:heme/copper-type cytochrome/quinol oxidase subunit 4